MQGNARGSSVSSAALTLGWEAFFLFVYEQAERMGMITAATEGGGALRECQTANAAAETLADSRIIHLNTAAGSAASGSVATQQIIQPMTQQITLRHPAPKEK